MRSETEPLPPARLGAYQILGVLGQGGMGVVYRARNAVTGELRALKVIRGDLAHDPEFVRRFFSEARLAASISHENVVRFIEPGMDGEVVFLPMELLRGESLHDVLQRAGRLSTEDAVAVLLCVCKGVSAMHARGLVHRDLKPMNVFLSVLDDGRITPKVLDFGAARDTNVGSAQTAQFVIGTAYYMAPEQAAASANADQRIDQYALGAIGYELLTGQHLYEDDADEPVIVKLLRGNPYPAIRELAPSVSEPVARVLTRALARLPRDRYASVDELAAALARAADPTRLGLSVSSGSVSAWDPEQLDDPGARAKDAAEMVSGLHSTCRLQGVRDSEIEREKQLPEAQATSLLNESDLLLSALHSRAEAGSTIALELPAPPAPPAPRALRSQPQTGPVFAPDSQPAVAARSSRVWVTGWALAAAGVLLGGWLFVSAPAQPRVAPPPLPVVSLPVKAASLPHEETLQPTQAEPEAADAASAAPLSAPATPPSAVENREARRARTPRVEQPAEPRCGAQTGIPCM